MIGIRVDANSEISIGHLMRCFSIADEVRNLGGNLVFISSDEGTCRDIADRGYKGICLSNDYRDKENEIDILKSILEKWEIKCLLLDSYEVTQTYMDVLNQAAALVYIDDIQKFDYRANTIINYSFDASADSYSASDFHDLMLGSAFTPLRKEFRDIRGDRGKNKKLESVFVSSGASDRFNMVFQVMDTILNDLQLNHIRINAVVGKFYARYQELLEYSDKHKMRIKLYKEVKDIWNVMNLSDIAISASGTTIAELCSMGIPTINFISADNQKNGANALAKAHAVVYAGDVRMGVESVLDNIISSIKAFDNGNLNYDEYSKQGMEIYDGFGARRIAEKLLYLDYQ